MYATDDYQDAHCRGNKLAQWQIMQLNGGKYRDEWKVQKTKVPITMAQEQLQSSM